MLRSIASLREKRRSRSFTTESSGRVVACDWEIVLLKEFGRDLLWSPCLAGVAAAPSADVAPLALATTPSGPWRAGATLVTWRVP